jgi:hypothetical protein
MSLPSRNWTKQALFKDMVHSKPQKEILRRLGTTLPNVKAGGPVCNVDAGGSSTSAKAVWLALVQLSSERKDPPDFDVEVALIAHLAGLSHRPL